MATKSELEEQDAAYQQKLSKAMTLEAMGLYRDAMKAAVDAWEHVDGMIQYQKRWGSKEITSIEAIDMALRYAPLLLDHRKLAELEQLLVDFKRIKKVAEDDPDEKLDEARQRLQDNYRLWTHLQQHAEVTQEDLAKSLGGDQAYWRGVCGDWHRMGLLVRKTEGRSYRISLSTRMGALTWGKCPACGRKEQAPKAMLLERMRCPKCKGNVTFVLLNEPSSAANGG